MNNEIRPGDLVMVVRPTACCGKSNSIGKIFSVVAIESKLASCKWCGRSVKQKPFAFTGHGKDAALLSRLQKLNPPSEQEIIEREKEIA